MFYLSGMNNETNTPSTMTYSISTTTRTATRTNGLQNQTSTLARMNFDTYEAACNAARAYAAAYGAFYVKPATEAPTLKEGETFVEVIAA